MNRARVLKLKHQGYRVAEIARLGNMTTGDVMAIVNAARKRGHYRPNEEETERAKRRLMGK